jgi:hypothetical protein
VEERVTEVDTGRFTVGVFQDVTWAERGLQALKLKGFPAEAITVLAKETPEVSALIERTLGGAPQRLELHGLGPVLARGALLEALGGSSGELKRLGLAGTMRRVGFQQHDGRIFETLTGRGGILVAIRSEPLAAEALATLHSYGGGNAAIGAWTGRV